MLDQTTAEDTRQDRIGDAVLVVGGAGFIGSHLCETLERAGREVFCLDDLSTGSEPSFQAGARRHFRRHDVIAPLPDDLPRFTEIYNLACPASPVHYQADPIRTALTSAQGVFMLLERAQRDGARFLQASTSEVYGDPDVHPQREDYHGNVNPVGPRACYDEGKRYAEMLCVEFAARRGVSVRIARIFNTYGPGMQADDGRVVSNFIVQALSGEPLTLYGDGSQTRSFCYVDDLVDGLMRLMACPDDGCGPVNLGNPLERTVAELAGLVLELTGSGSPLVRLPLPVDDPRRRRPDIGKAQRLLGWEPKVTAEDGLSRTIDHFREVVGAAASRRLAAGA